MAYTKIYLPIIDVNEEEAVITERLFKDGNKVESGDAVLVVENTKATKDVIADQSGYILFQCKEFDTMKNGDCVALIFDTVEELENFKSQSFSSNNENKKANNFSVNATKKAIALAEKLGVDISEIVSSNSGKLIKEKDVELFASAITSGKLKKERPLFSLKRERIVILSLIHI